MFQLNTAIYIFQKIFVVVGTIVYFIFATIVLKQTTSLSKNIHDKFNQVVVSAAFIHMIASVGLIFLALIIL